MVPGQVESNVTLWFHGIHARPPGKPGAGRAAMKAEVKTIYLRSRRSLLDFGGPPRHDIPLLVEAICLTLFLSSSL